jgi:O-antigen/teichoic acid export membrane protein
MVASSASPPSDMRPARPQTLTQSLIWFGGSYGISIFAYMAVNALVARALGADEFGYFVVLTSAALVIGQTALLGVQRSGLRDSARVRQRDDPALTNLRDDVAVVERTTIPTLSLLSGVLAGALAAGDVVERVGLGLATAAFVTGVAEQQLWANYLRGFGETRLAGLMEGRSGGALVALSQMVSLGALRASTGDVGLTGAVAALAVGYAPPVLVARLLVVRRWKHMPRTRLRLGRRLRGVLRRDWRFTVIAWTLAVQNNVEIWLGAVLLSAQDNSLYSASMRLAMQLPLAAMAIQVVFTPAISRLWAKDDIRSLERLLRTGATLSTVALLLVWIPIVAFPGDVMALLFGGEFRSAAPILTVLSLIGVVGTLSGMSGTLLTMTGNEGLPALAGGLAVAARLAFGVVTTQLFGPMGLAIGAVVLVALQNLALTFIVRKRLQIRLWPTMRPRLGLLRRTEA